jgi:hypothetical protein
METVETLKYETVANVGDIIKAYDFQPRGKNNLESYTVGVVQEKGKHPKDGWACYTITPIFRLCEGVIQTNESGLPYDRIYVPFQSIFDFENRVTKI